MLLCGRLTQALQKYHFLIRKRVPVMSATSGFHVSAADPETQFLEIKDEKTGSTRKIAYMKSNGPRTPGIIFIPGFMSHKEGTKAVHLYKFCQKYGFPYVRYDPSGMGESEGVDVKEVLFSQWIQDAKEVLLRVTDGPQLVVGSSMGGWISSMIAEKHPEKFSSLLLIAPAINFHRKYESILLSQLDKKSIQRYKEGGVVPLHRPDYGTFPLRKVQFDEMRKFELSLEVDSLNVNCPVRIIHGIQDDDVPYTGSLDILKALKTSDVQLLYLKDGDHRLSDENKLELICDKILEVASPKSNKI